GPDGAGISGGDRACSAELVGGGAVAGKRHAVVVDGRAVGDRANRGAESGRNVDLLARPAGRQRAEGQRGIVGRTSPAESTRPIIRQVVAVVGYVSDAVRSAGAAG